MIRQIDSFITPENILFFQLCYSDLYFRQVHWFRYTQHIPFSFSCECNIGNALYACFNNKFALESTFSINALWNPFKKNYFKTGFVRLLEFCRQETSWHQYCLIENLLLKKAKFWPFNLHFFFITNLLTYIHYFPGKFHDPYNSWVGVYSMSVM